MGVNTESQKQRQPKLPVLLEEDESNNTEDEDFVDARDIILEEIDCSKKKRRWSGKVHRGITLEETDGESKNQDGVWC